VSVCSEWSTALVRWYEQTSSISMFRWIDSSGTSRMGAIARRSLSAVLGACRDTTPRSIVSRWVRTDRRSLMLPSSGKAETRFFPCSTRSFLFRPVSVAKGLDNVLSYCSVTAWTNSLYSLFFLPEDINHKKKNSEGYWDVQLSPAFAAVKS
jgi:hypothetical protein